MVSGLRPKSSGKYGPFQYSPLPSTRSIRLLRIYAGDHSVPLRASLETVDVNEAGMYIAMSYAWGISQRIHTIYVDNHTIMITKSLFEALQDVRNRHRNMIVWADAICINQEDPEERAKQVEMMASIYRGAFTVFVHLASGRSREGDEWVFANARRLVENSEYLDSLRSASLRQDPNSPRDFITPFMVLSKKAWLRRVWTIQEIGLAQSATFISGSAMIPWDLLSSAYRILAEGLTAKELLESGFRPETVTNLDKMFARQRNWSFIQVLAETRYRQSTDPRDRIFALLSHPSARTGDSETEAIVSVDYNISLENLLMQTAVRIIEHMKNLDVFSYQWRHVAVSRQLESTNRANRIYVSSWAPTWDIVPETTLLLQPSIWPNACGDLQLDIDECMAAFRQQEPRLLLRGFRIGAIRHIFWSDRRWFTSSLLSPESVATMYNEILSFPEPKVAYGDSLRLLCAFGLAITADGLWYGVHMKHNDYFSDYWKDFAAFCKEYLFMQIGTTDEAVRGGWSERFVNAAWHVLRGRRLFCTGSGFLGLGPRNLTEKQADEVFILHGGRIPYALPPVGDDRHILIGECAVHGLMEGEIQNHEKHAKFSSGSLRIQSCICTPLTITLV